MPSVIPPSDEPLSHELLFPAGDKPAWQTLRSHLQQEGRITKPDALILLSDASALFKKETNLLYMEDPVTVVGDIHGQYFDLLRLL